MEQNWVEIDLNESNGIQQREQNGQNINEAVYNQERNKDGNAETVEELEINELLPGDTWKDGLGCSSGDVQQDGGSVEGNVEQLNGGVGVNGCAGNEQGLVENESRNGTVGVIQASQPLPIRNSFILLGEADPVPESLAGIITEVKTVTQRMDQFIENNREQTPTTTIQNRNSVQGFCMGPRRSHRKR